MSVSDQGLGELVSAIEGCDEAAQLASRAGRVIASWLKLRELWWVDVERGVLHARAGGLLPLEERPLEQLDATSAALVRSACAASRPCVLEGETAIAAGEAGKVSLLAVPLRRGERLPAVLALLSVRADAFSPRLVDAFEALSEPLAAAADRASPRAEVMRLRQELERARPLSLLGSLAAAAAHEIRNPLSAMIQAVCRLRSNPTLGTQDGALLEILLEELERVNRSAADLLALASPCTGRFASAEIGALVERVAVLLRHDPRLGTGVELVTAVDPGLPAVRIDADQIRQALWNLCLNAAQALPRGGRIVVRACARSEPTRAGVAVSICDDGPGIALERRERVFAPFETTRSEGTGLGLALVKRGIELHQGWIRLEEAPGGGTCVCFWLPVEGPIEPDAAQTGE